MKRLFLFLLITSATTCSISSCNKDEWPPLMNGHDENTALEPYTIGLIANQWKKVREGVYTCSCINVIPAAYRNNRGVKVFLVNADQKIQLEYPIRFMGGELSATATASDVTINYRCENVLPFSLLNLLIEIR
jgi:hypothetical protein